jgi:hypothetical protein
MVGLKRIETGEKMSTNRVCSFLKRVSFSCIFALALSLPGLPVVAAGTAVVSVSVPSQPVIPGAQFTVNITVQPNNAIAGCQFNLSFNPSLASVVSVSQGNLLTQNGASTYFSPGQINNSTGILNGVAGAITTPGQTVSAAGTLAVITMAAGSTKGTSALTLSDVVVGDINGQSLPVSPANGQVSIDQAPVLNPIGNKTVTLGSTLTFTTSGSDADGDILTYSASSLPAGASFNAATRIFSWTPSPGQVSTYNNVHFEVTDGTLIDSENISILVNKAAPTFSNLRAPSINFGATPTSLGGTIKSGTLVPSGNISITLNGVIQAAVIDATGNFTSSFPTGSLATSGSPYTISYTYTGNTNFNIISDNTNSLTINKTSATVTLSNLSQTYDGTAKSASASTNPAGLSVSTTYNGSPASPISAGSYSVAATINNTNYSGSASGTLTIAKATPAFSNLSAPSINLGTTSTSLGGTIRSGALIPSGNVSITLNGVTQTATIDSLGNFTSSFVASHLEMGGSPYAISFVYAGNSNFNSISDTTKKFAIIQTYSAWDTNTDGSVNVLDMISVSQHMGESGTSGWIKQDVNGDGTINVLDLVMIGQHWTG